MRIPVGDEQTPVLSFDYYEPVTRREIRPLAASKGWIQVEKGAAYTLSCDLRASKQDVPALRLRVCNYGPTPCRMSVRFRVIGASGVIWPAGALSSPPPSHGRQDNKPGRCRSSGIPNG